jgi:hypothetical protein
MQQEAPTMQRCIRIVLRRMFAKVDHRETPWNDLSDGERFDRLRKRD